MDPGKKIWLNLFARRGSRKFNTSLLRRAIAGLGVNDYGPRQERGERNLLEKLVRVLPQGSVVCDVGAHRGTYALFLATQRPDLIIHAFEPNPVVFKQLAENAAGRFKAHPFALGEEEGEALLHDPRSDGGSECASLVSAAVEELYRGIPKRTVPVPVKRFDGVAEALGIDHIDYLKIDAEGYDLMVLRGASGFIETDRIGIVQFEFNRMNVFSRTFMHDFYQLLPRHQFHRIVQDGLVPLGRYDTLQWELFGYQNIVAIPEGMAMN